MLTPFTKRKLNGIGDASATLVLAALAASASTVFLTSGLTGKISFWLLSKLFSTLASLGLVILNVGAEKLLTAVDKAKYDGSWETAEKMMQEIQRTGRDLSPEEIQKIDEGVINAFRKFAKIGRKKPTETTTPRPRGRVRK